MEEKKLVSAKKVVQNKPIEHVEKQHEMVARSAEELNKEINAAESRVVKTTEELNDLKKQEDMQKVTGIFKNNETQGGMLKFAIKKYAGEKITKYVMFDGQTYTIPRYVAKHLNQECSTPIYQYMSEGPIKGGGLIQGRSHNNERTMATVGKKNRFAFMITEGNNDIYYKKQDVIIRKFSN